MRSDDSDRGNAWQVSHLARDFEVILSHAETLVLQGPMDGRLQIAEGEMNAQSPWQNVCSEVNDEAAYVEFQQELDGGWQIDRQVFLARRDAFAFVADVIRGPGDLGPGDGVGEYRLRFPLAAPSQWVPAAETNEGQVRSGRRRVANVIPVCLPEWRADQAGSLQGTEDQLLLTVPVRSRAHAALFLDLSPQRFRKPVTWRRLTVGESLAAVPREVAAGYRVQIGRSQWLIYRSLGPAANRTVLGQNLQTEFLVARFLPTGRIERLLEIE